MAEEQAQNSLDQMDVAKTDAAQMKKISATVFFGPIWHQDTAVEAIYYEENDGVWKPRIVPLSVAHVEDGAEGQTVTYHGELPGHLAHGPHFSLRVRPTSPDFAHPLELPLFTTST